MQIGLLTSTAQARLNFTTRPTNFPSRGSPLNPLTRPSISTQAVVLEAQPQTDSTKTHLSNLEKLLQKQALKPPPPPIKQPAIENKGKGLLDGLDLARIWPEMKAVEEMSPRNLNHLQRLLSKTPNYSPRSTLGHRWREYHGCNDWEGLLDPLDDNLRREVVRYGEFVQAAYHAFHSNPTTSADGIAMPRHVALPDKSYQVTKSLYATSSVGLPKWVDDMAPDLGWMTQRSSWIGYVAVCDDKREIARMGRRDIVIALRGTGTCLEWVENLRDFLVRLPNNSPKSTKPKVECGFLSLFKTSASIGGADQSSQLIPSLAESLVNEVMRLMELYKGETLSITVTGHSLGAALALLAANELSTSIKHMINGTDREVPPIAVYSFGGPRVGNRGFADCLTDNGVKVLRVVNSQDMITRVPGMFVSETLDQKLRQVKANSLLDALDNNMPWAYSHVGKELRIDSKMSPYLKPNADVACCHDLEAYLHLVDGFLSSNCPFRANAKRSLVKLLHQQGSNVKKLYTTKAKALNVSLDKDPALISPCLPSPS